MILYEDKEMIVCHKRVGMPVQSASVRQKDMVSVLRNHLGGGDVYVVHRLDQPVEGVVVFAKTKAAAADLSRQIANGSMRKVYQAVVELPEDAQIAEYGNLADGQNRLSLNEWYPLVDYLVKDGRTNRSFVSEAGRPGAKRAELRYRILKWWAKTQPKCQEEQPTKLQPKCQEEHPTKLQSKCQKEQPTEVRPKCQEEQPTEVRPKCQKEQQTELWPKCQEEQPSGIEMRFHEGNSEEGQKIKGNGDRKAEAESVSRLALVEIELMTGRHHQIRVQMAHAGLPLVGDRKYNPRYTEYAENEKIRYAEDAKNGSASGYGEARLSPFRKGVKAEEMVQAGETFRRAAFQGNGGAEASTSLALCAVSLTFRHPSTKKRVTYEVTPQFTGNLQAYYF